MSKKCAENVRKISGSGENVLSTFVPQIGSRENVQRSSSCQPTSNPSLLWPLCRPFVALCPIPFPGEGLGLVFFLCRPSHGLLDWRFVAEGARAMLDVLMDASEMGSQGFLFELALPNGGGVLRILFDKFSLNGAARPSVWTFRLFNRVCHISTSIPTTLSMLLTFV